MTESSEVNRRHFEFEKIAALAILKADPADRPRVYGEVYGDLYARFPHLQITDDHESTTRNQVALVSQFVTPTSDVLEIGCGRGFAAQEIAARARSLIATDVACLLVADLPPNAAFRLYDGTTLPVGDASVDLCYHSDVLEHLHPDDARHLVEEMHRVLRPGGAAVIVTPNRVSGPHNVAKHFSTTVEGLHLKEYITAETARLMRSCGFRSVSCYVGAKGVYRSMNTLLWSGVEACAAMLPHTIRRGKLIRSLVSDRTVAYK